jgi:phage shock protein A
MGVMKRVSMIFKSKANKALDRMEDPRETLDYSYQRQLELLTKVRRGVADVATSRKRIELQMNQLQGRQNTLDKQARDALAVGREDLAREALTRKSSVQGQIDGLQQQYASLQSEEEKLTRASQGLQAKVESFRAQKETIKATYTAAEAQTRIGEAFSGISEEMGDVGMAVQRAEDKTAQMQARAGAIDELLASGALDDVAGPPRDDIQAELDRMGSSSDVELELAKLKGELGQGEAPREIAGNQESGKGQAAAAQQSQPDGSQQPTASQQAGPQAPSGSEPQNPAGEGA